VPAAKPTVPPFADLTDKKLRSLGAKLDKLVDANGFKHNNLLWKHANDAGALLWHLARHGLVLQEVRSAGMFRLLGENAGKATSADIVAVLRRIGPDMGVLDKGEARDWTMLTPGVLTSVDELITAAYVDDRTTLMNAREELPDNLKLAIDFVRRRAGETIEPAASEAILRHLIAAHCGSSLALNIDVPRIVDGTPVVTRLADQAAVEALAGLFGPPSAWAELSLQWVLQRVKPFRERASSIATAARQGLRLASLSDLLFLFGDGWWESHVLLDTLDARADSPAELFAAAERLAAEGTEPFRITTPQLKEAKPEPVASDDEGEEEEDEDEGGGGGGEYDEYDEYAGEGDEAGAEEEQEIEAAPGDNERVRVLAMILTIVGLERAKGEGIPANVVERFDLRRVFDSEPQLVARLRGVLAAMSREQAHAVIRAALADKFWYGRAAAVADVHFDAGLVEQMFARIGEGEYGVDAGLLGFCSPAIVPLIVQAQARSRNPKIAGTWGEAILYVLARASAAGQDWDPELDREIQLDQIRFSYGGSKVDPVLAMLDKLPLGRWIRVVEANVERCSEEPWRLVRVLRAEVPAQLLDMVFGALMTRRQAIASGSLGERLRKFGPEIVAPLLRAIGDAPAENTFVKELERALAHEVFAAVKEGLGKAIETPEQELRRLAASVPGPTVRVYRLARGEGEPGAGTVARIGGTPRGVTEVPQDRGEPMQHIITLDLAELPELAGRHPGVRSVSLYLPDPESGSRHEHGKLVWTREEELGRAEGSTAGARSVRVEAFDVPRVIFEGRDLEGAAKRVRGIVYTSHGYVGGGPLWLQEGTLGVDPSFVFQFDEGLCSINLGDMGVMYVYEGDVTWQCH
jgi:hypothetical protein